jgi:D-cysteine desulfhydrase
MGTTAGLALGLALAGLPTTVHAVRVTDARFASEIGMRKLIDKIATMMRLYGAHIPADSEAKTALQFRDEFFGDGYAKSNPQTDAAVDVARQQLGLSLESTYTGKAMRALLHDLQVNGQNGETIMFWNTYNSRPWPVQPVTAADRERLPGAFKRYLQTDP